MTLPFPPPNFLAPRIGIILSIIKINKAMIKLKTRKKGLIVIEGEKLNIKRPLHDVSGPGIIGIKLPIIPRRINKLAKTIINRSTDQKYHFISF